jgi:hypothetical protein
VLPLGDLTLTLILGLLVGLAQAHQDPCHRRHACPSDQGTYGCGDLGHCEQCPDTPFCRGGNPTPTAQQTPRLTHPPSSRGEGAACATVTERGRLGALDREGFVVLEVNGKHVLIPKARIDALVEAA